MRSDVSKNRNISAPERGRFFRQLVCNQRNAATFARRIKQLPAQRKMHALNVFITALLVVVESQCANNEPAWIDECLDAYCDVLNMIDAAWMLTPSDCMCDACIAFFHETVDMCIVSIGVAIGAHSTAGDPLDAHSIAALRIVPRMIVAGLPEFLLKFVRQKEWAPVMRARAANALGDFVLVDAVAKSMLQQGAIRALCDVALEYDPDASMRESERQMRRDGAGLDDMRQHFMRRM